MQLVRDQADWLLTNIIPQHAVESLKTNTKYSENHKLTAVMFASVRPAPFVPRHSFLCQITNWHEMYEENFEGGREFLRVLNEVIGDFDELLDRADFAHVEKIKVGVVLRVLLRFGLPSDYWPLLHGRFRAEPRTASPFPAPLRTFVPIDGICHCAAKCIGLLQPRCCCAFSTHPSALILI